MRTEQDADDGSILQSGQDDANPAVAQVGLVEVAEKLKVKRKPRAKKSDSTAKVDLSGLSVGIFSDSQVEVKTASKLPSLSSLGPIKPTSQKVREFSVSDVPCLAQEHGDNWSFYQGDCVELTKGIPDDTVHYSVYSIPFKSLYTYSNSERDFGNSRNDSEFNEHYTFLVREKLRITKPGRLTSIHCMNIPTTIQHHGQIGIEDFRGDIIRIHVGGEAADFYRTISLINRRMENAMAEKIDESDITGRQQRMAHVVRLEETKQRLLAELREFPAFEGGWIFHSEVCIWKDPVTAMQRTKAIGLLHKQIKKDSCMSRMGIPDYVLTFRKPGVNPEPVEGEFDHWTGDDSFKSEGRLSIDIWQRYASPVWGDIRMGRTLQYMQARAEDDERHICALQKDVVERCLDMWSNPGDIVLSPFGGIGTEPYCAVEMGRRGIGFELKESYFQAACRNMRIAEQEAKNKNRTLF